MRQESHRIYWQQWEVSNEQDSVQQSSDEVPPKLITGSAAVRISEAARAADVTGLLRQTLDLTESSEDALVLVGTLPSSSCIQFEHEQQQQQQDKKVATPRESEPLHVVRTLRLDENPLAVRDGLLEHLKRRRRQRHASATQRSVIAPRLQWFFVPTSPLTNNCIELDGYCTSIEEEWEDDSDDSDNDGEEDATLPAAPQDDPFQYPWRQKALCETTTDGPAQRSSALDATLAYVAKQQRRLNQLANCQSALDRHTVSGYLYKRSNKDRHVWRRMHCVLTDDHLWFVSRLYEVMDNQRVARHQRVSLNRALLLKSTDDYAPLQRIPFSFEVVSSTGTSHIFRAANRKLQLRWIQCLGDRIIQCHENRQIEHAELIVEDEAVARHRRISNLAAAPLAAAFAASQTAEERDNIMALLRWGVEVADYREQCRHIQGRMPTRKRVETSEGAPDVATPRKLFDSPASNGHFKEDHEVHDSEEGRLLAETRDRVRSAWDSAAVLLARASQLAADHQYGKQDNNGKRSSLPRKLEALCQHVDYVITGRFRPLSEAAVESQPERVDRSYDPSPIDLFDPLLAELQTQVGASLEEKVNGTS